MTTYIKQNPLFVEKPPSLMMLKDYLRDDFSSCSSNGFKSFPRRPCYTTTTVRFLLEIDLNTTTTKSKNNSNFAKLHHHEQQNLKKSKSSKSVPSSTFSALQKAVINAVKLLPFPSSSSKSSSPSPSKLLPRKLFRRCFSRKTDGSSGRITWWRLFHQILEETNDKKQSINHNTNRQHSTCSSSNSWSEGEFSGNSESYSSISSRRNDIVTREGEKYLPNEKNVSQGVGETVAKEWANEEAEHFSPVSVLDCPLFLDEGAEELDSPFQRRLARVEGPKRKFKLKIRSFGSLTAAEPVNLEKQLELAGFENNESSLSIDDKEETAQELVDYVKKALIPSTNLIFKVDGMLLDFFRERIHENHARNNNNNSKIKGNKEFKQEQLEIVKDWINGRPQEMILGWEEKDGRQVYVKDMERSGKWRNRDEEKEELALEIEMEIFRTMVNEALLDLL